MVHQKTSLPALFFSLFLSLSSFFLFSFQKLRCLMKVPLIVKYKSSVTGFLCCVFVCNFCLFSLKGDQERVRERETNIGPIDDAWGDWVTLCAFALLIKPRIFLSFPFFFFLLLLCVERVSLSVRENSKFLMLQFNSLDRPEVLFFPLSLSLSLSFFLFFSFFFFLLISIDLLFLFRSEALNLFLSKSMLCVRTARKLLSGSSQVFFLNLFLKYYFARKYFAWSDLDYFLALGSQLHWTGPANTHAYTHKHTHHTYIHHTTHTQHT